MHDPDLLKALLLVLALVALVVSYQAHSQAWRLRHSSRLASWALGWLAAVGACTAVACVVAALIFLLA